MYRILIVDDEPIVRRGIKKSVNWNELDIEMVAEAENGVEALEQVISSQPDIILLDILMPGITGIAAAQEIRKYNKTAKIVFLTSSHEYALDSYSVKAAGYILKPIMEDKLFACLDDLASEINIEKEKFITIKTAK
ncbi:MAG: response regulator, partial [Christensenellaceae bacterium]